MVFLTSRDLGTESTKRSEKDTGEPKFLVEQGWFIQAVCAYILLYNEASGRKESWVNTKNQSHNNSN